MSRLYIPFRIKGKKPRLFIHATDNSPQELRQQLLLTWFFISQEGLLDEAIDFLRDHEGTTLPFA